MEKEAKKSVLKLESEAKTETDKKKATVEKMKKEARDNISKVLEKEFQEMGKPSMTNMLILQARILTSLEFELKTLNKQVNLLKNEVQKKKKKIFSRKKNSPKNTSR